MITDIEKNFIYLADTLPERYPLFFDHFSKAIISNGIQLDLLKGTADVWAVDYMPVQLDANTFIKYSFNPEYLNNEDDKLLITDVDKVWHLLNLKVKTKTCDLTLEGGNLLYEKDKMIVTTNIFKENPGKMKKQIIDKLEQTFEVKVIIVPVYPGDWTGHADGDIRFINADTMLINEPDKKNVYYRKLTSILKEHKLDFIHAPCSVDSNSTSVTGLYLNYLQVGNVVFVPVFDIDDDERAILFFENVFKGCTIVPVRAKLIAMEGGVLRCVSWIIKSVF